jgi:hypothetical protein
MQMANFGNPAYSAVMGNMAGMSMIAAGVVGLASAVTAGLDAAADARRQNAYYDALGAATAHADDMEDLARTAVEMIAELEAEVASLRRACRQRQEVIDLMAARGRA